MFIQWGEDVATHHGAIDDDHRHMFALVNRLNDAMQANAFRADIGQLLDDLVDCTRDHFQAEERAMRAHDYALLAEHAHKHQALLAQLETFVTEFQSGKMSITSETMAFLHEWLTLHIQRDDRKLADFLTNDGASRANGSPDAP